MSETKYDYDAIRGMRRKYKWLIWLYQFVCIFTISILLLELNRIIPDNLDAIGFFDSSYNYHYFFGIKSFVGILAVVFVCIVLFVIIPLIIKKVLKQQYVEFLVAKHNGNISPEKYKTVNKIILFLLFCIVVFSASNIGYIKVETEDFYLKKNILSIGASQKYSFEYLDTHKPYSCDSANIAFFNTNSENRGIVLDFYIGKYSSGTIKFLEVLDERTNYKYFLAEKFAE